MNLSPNFPKIIGEIKYHVIHANTWMVHLGAKGNEESHERMQTTLHHIFPLALVCLKK
jgi:ring-1,2-phenylacetyl-CoA epoxidase subunit PaaC